jgi:hypothetical protein
MTTYKVVLIPCVGEITELTLSKDDNDFERIIGCEMSDHLSLVGCEPNYHLTMFVDDSGMSKGLPTNVKATLLAQHFHNRQKRCSNISIVGNCLVVNEKGPNETGADFQKDFTIKDLDQLFKISSNSSDASQSLKHKKKS